MPTGKLEIKNIAHRGDPEPTYEALFLTDTTSLWTTSVSGADLEELLYEKLRLSLENADQLLADVRSNGHGVLENLSVEETDLVGAHMRYLRNDAA
jgi:hypothetical protein